jgi:hypothetical protein
MLPEVMPLIYFHEYYRFHTNSFSLANFVGCVVGSLSFENELVSNIESKEFQTYDTTNYLKPKRFYP